MASRKLTRVLIEKGASLLEALADDFAKKARPFYVVMRWTWSGGIANGVPSETDISATVYSLARELVRATEHAERDELTSLSASTGGIEVEVRTVPSSEAVVAEVRFVPVSDSRNSRL